MTNPIGLIENKHIKIFTGRDIRKATMKGNVNSDIFGKGKEVEVRRYDSRDDTYLVWRNGSGIWVKESTFEYEPDTPAYQFKPRRRY